jgi:multimeric flavodoxin WrbA
LKALAICGSPRLGGNTEQLLRRCLGRLETNGIQGELIALAGRSIQGCTACNSCRGLTETRCGVDDDFNPVLERILAADIVIVGSPVHFGAATPVLSAVLDRAGYVARGKANPLSRKLGGPIVVARRAGHNFTYAQLLLWYMINDMIVPGSSYWNVAFGREVGEVQNDDEGLRTIDRFADNLAFLAERLADRA